LNDKLVLQSQIYFSSTDQYVGGGVGAYSICWVLLMGWLYAHPSILPNKKQLNTWIQHECEEMKEAERYSILPI